MGIHWRSSPCLRVSTVKLTTETISKGSLYLRCPTFPSREVIVISLATWSPRRNASLQLMMIDLFPRIPLETTSTVSNNTYWIWFPPRPHSFSIHYISIQMERKFCAWVPLQPSPWNTHWSFSWPLDEYPWLWCPHIDFQTYRIQHQVCWFYFDNSKGYSFPHVWHEFCLQ